VVRARTRVSGAPLCNNNQAADFWTATHSSEAYAVSEAENSTSAKDQSVGSASEGISF